MLELRRLNLIAAGTPIVVDANMTVADGESVGLIGPSGAGKSLIAQAVVGLVPRPGVSVTRGEVRFEGRDLLSMPPADRRAVLGAKIGYIPQQPLLALNPVLSVGHQADLILRRHTRWGSQERRSRVIDILRTLRFSEPERIYEARPGGLSGGERQRALLTICLALRPSLVVADEPTASLDKLSQARLVELLDRLRREWGFALLIIGHDPGIMRRLVDRVYRLNERSLESAALPSPVAPAAPPSFPDRTTASVPVLEVASLEKRFDRRPVLQDVNLALWRGECLGVFGASGAGKTTLARCISGLMPRSGGRVSLRLKNGEVRELSRLDPSIQVVFQDPAASFDPRLTLYQSLEEALRLRGVPRREQPDRIGLLCAAVGLDPAVLRRRPGDASGGECQRTAIARALAVEPAVLIADEATSALDAAAEERILDLLAGLARERGIGVIFNSHNLRALARICGRLVIMDEGRVTEDRATRDILLAPQTAIARELVEATAALS